MERWHDLAQRLLGFIDRYDEWAIVLFVLVEEAGLPLPVPGDVAMLLAGYRVARGEMNLIWILFLLMLATLAGSSLLYWLGARGGRPLLYRYGRFLHCDEARLVRIELWLAERGLLAVFLGRLIPGLRIITPLAAGAFGVRYRTFVPALMLSSFIYVLALVLFGMWAGPWAIEALETLHLPLRATLTTAGLLLLGVVLVLLQRRANGSRHLAGNTGMDALPAARLETALMAGFLSTILMALGVNLLLYALAAVDVLRPEAALLGFVQQAAERVAGGSVPRLVLVLVGLMLLTNLLLAVLYARVAVRVLPGPVWLRGLLFALLPLALWGLVLLPLLGAGPFGLGLGVALWPLAGELVRNALFGFGLATFYALLLQARARPPAPSVA